MSKKVPDQQRHSFTHQSRRMHGAREEDERRHSQQTSVKTNRPMSGPFPQGFYYPHDTSAISSEMMPWNTFPGQINTLADAYGASHGQPQAGTPSLDWMNGMAATMLADPATQAYPYGSYLMGHNSISSNMYGPSPQLLVHQLAQMQLQNMTHDQIAAQQNLLLSQIQQTQVQRNQVQQQFHTEPSLDHPSRDSPVLASGTRPSSFLGGETADPSLTMQQQLHPDLTKALSAMEAIRQQYHEKHASAEKKSSHMPKSPRPNSFAGRDNCDPSSLATPMRSDAKKYPMQQRVDKEFPDHRRSVTPSIVIDQVNVEATDEDLERKANSVGMRIGPRIATVVHEVTPTDTRSFPTNTPERISTRTADTRHSTIQAGTQPTLIQPRRQPRGPPTESFFANNFLARRSLRTRREAMLKLCASPRAQNFGSSRNSAPPSLSKQM